MTFLLEGNCLGWIRWGGARALMKPLLSPALGWGLRRVPSGSTSGCSHIFCHSPSQEMGLKPRLWQQEMPLEMALHLLC